MSRSQRQEFDFCCFMLIGRYRVHGGPCVSFLSEADGRSAFLCNGTETKQASARIIGDKIWLKGTGGSPYPYIKEFDMLVELSEESCNIFAAPHVYKVAREGDPSGSA